MHRDRKPAMQHAHVVRRGSCTPTRSIRRYRTHRVMPTSAQARRARRHVDARTMSVSLGFLHDKAEAQPRPQSTGVGTSTTCDCFPGAPKRPIAKHGAKLEETPSAPGIIATTPQGSCTPRHRNAIVNRHVRGGGRRRTVHRSRRNTLSVRCRRRLIARPIHDHLTCRLSCYPASRVIVGSEQHSNIRG